MELKYICKICGFEAKNHTSLTSHLQYNHKDYTTKLYYDKFYKKENEGICEVCGKPAIFKNMVKGYLPCCSKSCAHKTKKFLNSFRKSINEKSEIELKEWRNKSLETKKSKSSNGKCITDEVLKHKEEKALKHYQSWFPYITDYHNNIVKGICPECHREWRWPPRCWGSPPPQSAAWRRRPERARCGCRRASARSRSAAGWRPPARAVRCRPGK